MSTQFTNSRPSFKLKVMNNRQRAEWKEDCERTSLIYAQRDWGNSLDDFCDHVFYPGNTVWVKTTEGNWLQGAIVSTSVEPLIGPTKLDGEGFYYEVRFGPRMNLRKYFSPRNGEIKPDIECVRQMLKQRGYQIY